MRLKTPLGLVLVGLSHCRDYRLMLAQALLLLLFTFALPKMFWQKRWVVMPTMPANNDGMQKVTVRSIRWRNA